MQPGRAERQPVGVLGRRRRPGRRARWPARPGGRSRGRGCARCRAGARASRRARTAPRRPARARRRRAGRGRRRAIASGAAHPRARRPTKSTEQPIARQDLAQRVAGLGGRARPVAHASPRRRSPRPARGTARRSTGPARSCGRAARTGPGATAQRLASVSSTSTPCSRSIATVISMWGSDGTGLPSWRTSTPVLVAGPGQQQRGDELRRTPTRRSTTVPPRTEPVPRTVNGSDPRPPSSTSTPSARSAVEHLADRARAACAGRRRTTPTRWTGPPPAARTASPCRPGRSRPRRRPRRGAGRDGPVVTGGRRREPSAVSAVGHQRGVARPEGAPYDGRAVGDRGQHQGAVGERLAAGQRHHRVAPARAARGAGQGSAVRVVVTRQGYRAPASAEPRGRQPGLAPRGCARCLASRRTSLAARRARQATPGLPSVSTAASRRPPRVERFLKKWSCWFFSAPGRTPPRTGGRPASSAPARRPAVAASRGAPCRSPARPPAASWTAALIRTSVTGSSGTGTVGASASRPGSGRR